MNELLEFLKGSGAKLVPATAAVTSWIVWMIDRPSVSLLMLVGVNVLFVFQLGQIVWTHRRAKRRRERKEAADRVAAKAARVKWLKERAEFIKLQHLQADIGETREWRSDSLDVEPESSRRQDYIDDVLIENEALTAIFGKMLDDPLGLKVWPGSEAFDDLVDQEVLMDVPNESFGVGSSYVLRRWAEMLLRKRLRPAESSQSSASTSATESPSA